MIVVQIFAKKNSIQKSKRGFDCKNCHCLIEVAEIAVRALQAGDERVENFVGLDRKFVVIHTGFQHCR